MPRLFVLLPLLALGAALPDHPRTQGAGGVTVTLLANEGVHLSSGTQQVLIDGLFRYYGSEFALPADSTRAALEGARAPFDSVDLVLVTHRHGDHFHPTSMVSHLAANPRATLVTSRQVIDSMRGSLATASAVRSQLRAYTTEPGRRSRLVVGGIPLEVLGLPHGGVRHRRVEHLGFVVDIGGRRVLHVGDTDISEASFAPFRLDTARIDVALLPSWMVTSDEGRRVIAQWIKPKHVVVFHLPDNDERQARAAANALPGAISMSRSLERRTF
ncbi:MAG: MBL fold metallo-hydrolase [Cytophagaceae bacterium]|nr:MBL fold metallo-hydrolase [Gemmatimonadaceae bacterium]